MGIEVKAAPKIMSASEEKRVDEQIQSLQDVQDGKEVVQGVKWDSQDPKVIDQRLADLKRTKKLHGVPELNPQERDRAQKELKALTEDLQKDMPNYRQFRMHPSEGPEYMEMVDLIVKWESDPVRREKVKRWQNLRRMLDPMNPRASSTVYLFPK